MRVPGHLSLRLSPSKSHWQTKSWECQAAALAGPWGTAALDGQPCLWTQTTQALALPQQERAQALLFKRDSQIRAPHPTPPRGDRLRVILETQG